MKKEPAIPKKKEPAIPKNKKCIVCKTKPLVPIQGAGAGHEDAFCSTICCREYFDAVEAVKPANSTTVERKETSSVNA